MHARKLLCLLLSALLAVTLLAACGGSNFSKDAMAAVNAIQDTIEFETDSQLTKALREAIESGGDVRTTLLQKLGYSDALTLTAGGLRAAKAGQHALAIYSITGDDPDDAAQTAADYIKNILDSLSGGQYTGKIAMIQIDGVYYIAVDVTVVEPAPSGGSEDDGDDDPTPDPGYYQTSSNSYVVTTNEGFAALVDEKLSSDGLEATNITLDCDVTIPANWPYGMTYSGTFDGQNHTVSGVACTDGSDYSGMFRTLTGAVQNTNFANVNIDGGEYSGAVAGYNNGGRIDNCHVTSGTVVGTTQCTGGLVGYNSGTISNSSASCNIEGDSYTGGIVGYNSNVISNCEVSGQIQSDQPYTGGIAGGSAGTISNCTVSGDVSISFPEDAVVGGILGANYQGSVENCTVSGKVSSTGRLLGGIAGQNTGNISDSHATGTVEGTYVVGGIVGQNGSTSVSASVEACYATGMVKGFNAIGGVAGINNGTLTACYSEGNIIAEGAGSGYVGGVASSNTETGTIKFCYSTGNVIAPQYGGGLCNTNGGVISACYTTSTVQIADSSLAGALIRQNSGTISTCYWDSGSNTGIGVNYGHSSNLAKIGDNGLTWEQATQNMNNVSGSGIQFVYHNDGQAPTLPI